MNGLTNQKESLNSAVSYDDGDNHIGPYSRAYLDGTRIGYYGTDGDTIVWGNDD